MKSLRSKLVAALIGAGALIGVANAEEVIVYEAPVDNSSRVTSANFAANRELGRAWVEVEVQSSSSGSEPAFDPPIEKQVDGLYYDSAQKQVLYRTATGPIVCAEDASTLGETYLKSTGNCRLIPSTERRQVDDGFEIHDRKVAKLVFDAQTSSPRQQAAASRQ